MISLFRYWLDLCLLRAAPQDGSASGFILAFSLSVYFMVSIVVLTASYGMADGLRLAITEIFLLTCYIVSLLYLTNKAARIPQALSAIAGAGSVLGMISLPLVLLQPPVTSSESIPSALSCRSQDDRHNDRTAYTNAMKMRILNTPVYKWSGYI